MLVIIIIIVCLFTFSMLFEISHICKMKLLDVVAAMFTSLRLCA